MGASLRNAHMHTTNFSVDWLGDWLNYQIIRSIYKIQSVVTFFGNIQRIRRETNSSGSTIAHNIYYMIYTRRKRSLKKPEQEHEEKKSKTDVQIENSNSSCVFLLAIGKHPILCSLSNNRRGRSNLIKSDQGSEKQRNPHRYWKTGAIEIFGSIVASEAPLRDTCVRVCAPHFGELISCGKQRNQHDYACLLACLLALSLSSRWSFPSPTYLPTFGHACCMPSCYLSLTIPLYLLCSLVLSTEWSVWNAIVDWMVSLDAESSEIVQKTPSPSRLFLYCPATSSPNITPVRSQPHVLHEHHKPRERSVALMFSLSVFRRRSGSRCDRAFAIRCSGSGSREWWALDAECRSEHYSSWR